MATSWKIQQTISNIESEHARRIYLCKTKGLTLRTLSGHRMFWKGGHENIPTIDQRETAKKALKPFRVSHNAWCPCCETTYSIPSEYCSVEEHGVCNNCHLYVMGVLDGVLVTRAPTLKEALSVEPNDIRKGEAWVMYDALHKLRVDEI